MPNYKYAPRLHIPTIGTIRVHYESKVPWEWSPNRELTTQELFHAARLSAQGTYVRIYAADFSHSFDEQNHRKAVVTYSEIKNQKFFDSMALACETRIQETELTPYSPSAIVRERYCYYSIIPTLATQLRTGFLNFGAPEEDA